MQGLVSTNYICTNKQPTDVLTKCLPRVQHEVLSCKLGIQNIFRVSNFNLRGSVKDTMVKLIN